MILSFLKKYKIELLLFCAVFLVRIVYAVGLQWFFGSHTFISFSDASTYLKLAQNFVEYGVLSQADVSPALVPDPMRTPLYPLFLSFFVLLKTPLLLIVMAQSVLSGGMAVIAYRIGIRVFNSPGAGIIAGLVFSVEPMSIYWNALLMSEILTSFLFLLSVCLFLYKKPYWSAFALGLTALTRPTFLYLFPLLLLMYLYNERQRILFSPTAKEVWRLAGRLVLICIIFSATIFPWMLRNKIQFDQWSLSSNGWLALYYFNGDKFAELHQMPYKKIPYDWLPLEEKYQNEPYKEFMYFQEFETSDLYKEYIIGQFKAYPLDFIGFQLTSAFRGLGNHDYRYIVEHVVHPKVPSFSVRLGEWLISLGQVGWFVIYALALVGFIVGRNKADQLFLISFYVANNLLTGYISVVSGKYHLPFLLIVLLFAGYGLIYLRDLWKKRRQPLLLEMSS